MTEDIQPHVRARILAVDDTPANLVVLDAVLGKDHELITAHSGGEALKILASRHDIDVILLDVQMPVMDGYEVASRVKKLPGCEDIPIVFITAIYTEDPDVKRGYAVGGVDYFTKPFDPDILRLKVDVYASFRQRASVLKERERQVRESEEVLRVGRKLLSILDDLPVGIILADSNGRVCQVNEQVLKILTATKKVASDAYGELLSWWDHDGRAIKDATLGRDEESPTRKRLAIRRPDGTSKDVVTSVSPLIGAGAVVVGAVIVLQDVTEQRRFEVDLEQRINKLVCLNNDIESGGSLKNATSAAHRSST